MKSYPELASMSEEAGLPLDRVIREELQKLILRYLSEKLFFTGGVFQGGTAIRLLYGGVRFSEDLDFVFRSIDDASFRGLEGSLKRLPGFLRRQVPFAVAVTLGHQKSSPILERFRVRVKLEGRKGGLVINLEFANVRSLLPATRLLRVDPVDVPLVVEEEIEILADKLVALSLRDFIKGRDLWDIAYLARERRVELPAEDLVFAKAMDYGCEPRDLLSRLGRRLPSLEEEGLRAPDAAMKRFLPKRLYGQLAGAFRETIAQVSEIAGAALARLEDKA